MALVHSKAWRLKSARKSHRVTPAMMRRLRTYGSPESVDPGAHLFRQGERLVDLFVVVQGERPLAEVRPLSVTATQPRLFGLGAGQFTVPADFDRPLPEDVLREFEGA